MGDIYVTICDMPIRISAYTVALPDGNYTIIINDKLSQQARINAYRHELIHIHNDDYTCCNEKNVDLLEIYTHTMKQGRSISW